MTVGVTCCVERGGKGKRSTNGGRVGVRTTVCGRANFRALGCAWVCLAGGEWRVELTLGSAPGTKNLGGGVTGSRGVVVGGEQKIRQRSVWKCGSERQKGKRGLQVPSLTRTLQ